VQSPSSSFSSEILFSIASEKELIESFRLRDQKKLLLPDDLEFPLNIDSYLVWKEPSGVYTYLVFKMPNWDLPRGVVFKRTAASGEPTGGLCSWCHAYGSNDEIGMLSVTMSATVSFSYFLCQDLSCVSKIEETAARSGKDPDKNIADLYYKIGKLFENISSHKPD
jgi:hypothetical protein